MLTPEKTNKQTEKNYFEKVTPRKHARYANNGESRGDFIRTVISKEAGGLGRTCCPVLPPTLLNTSPKVYEKKMLRII